MALHCDGVLSFNFENSPICSVGWTVSEELNTAEALLEFEKILIFFFEFDLELFSLIGGSTLSMWAVGYCLGRMMFAWRKAQ